MTGCQGLGRVQHLGIEEGPQSLGLYEYTVSSGI